MSTDPAILAELTRYGREPHHQEVDRVRAAILRLAGSDLAKVRQMTDAACLDYRDVLLWAEYTHEGCVGERVVARDHALTVIAVHRTGPDVTLLVALENLGTVPLVTTAVEVAGAHGRCAVTITSQDGSPAPASVAAKSRAELRLTTTDDPPLVLTFWPLSLGAEPIVIRSL
jgi:hypothetical protein